MLPKIAVGVFKNKSDFLQLFDIKESAALVFESEAPKLDELRSWIYSGINILKSHPKYSMIIWNADSLSPECQSVLLKPMEELESNMRMILVVENENALLPTIVSRGEVEYFQKPEVVEDQYWNEVRKCWSSGPAACIAFVDSLDKDKEMAILTMEEVILKLKTGLTEEVNKKRLLILDSAIDCLYNLKQTNINQKLLMDHFLMESWKIIKS